jgi:hypothetical protein
MKKKVFVLKNLYTGEVVHTENFKEVSKVGEYNMISVYKPENPERKYLVNREAFKILHK